jgi:hypothetical protein
MPPEATREQRIKWHAAPFLKASGNVEKRLKLARKRG